MDLRVLVPKRVQIYLLFYKPTRQDPFQNRLVSIFDSPFCHVEMAIPQRFGEEPWERTVWGSSIYQDEAVFFKEKTYKRDGYVSIAIEVTVTQLYNIRAYCRHHAERGTPFSLIAMYAAYLPFQLVDTEATFCSKHVTNALKAGGVRAVESLNASTTTPSRLYHALKRQAILQVIPSRMMMMGPPPPPVTMMMTMMRAGENGSPFSAGAPSPCANGAREDQPSDVFSFLLSSLWRQIKPPPPPPPAPRAGNSSSSSSSISPFQQILALG